jgi:tetratricopeptide (TPR) repeat protein
MSAKRAGNALAMSPERAARSAGSLLLALALCAPARAQEPPPAKPGKPSVSVEFGLEQPDERASFAELSGDKLTALDAYAALRSGEPIRARELAQQLLAADPDSIPGHVVLGSVLYEVEGDLARARHELLLGKASFERKYGRTADNGDEQLWHALALATLDQIAADMGSEKESLGYQREWEQAYPAQKRRYPAWMLMRLGRLDEAREVAEQTLANATDVSERNQARTTLCAVEAERLDREGSYRACLDAAQASTAEGGHDAVVWWNAAEAASMALRLDEIEGLLLKATEYGVQDYMNPWADLVRLYTSQGRLAEASACLKQMVAWREAQAGYARAQSWAWSDLAAATFLLAAGRPGDAEHIVERALAAPDRHGASNEDPEQRTGAAAILEAAVLRARAEEAREAASWEVWWRALPRWLEAQWLDLRAWLAQRRAVDALSNERLLINTVRPYMADQLTLYLTEWLQPDVVRVLGPGLASAALARARAAETHPQANGWFAAFETEIAAARGDEAATGAWARRSLIELPQSEVLLRARVAALHGEAARREGDLARSVAAYDLVLQRDPGAVRRLGLALPVVIAASGGPLAERAADLLRASPRLAQEATGFRVEVVASGESARACLLGGSGERIGCGRVEPRAGEDADARARRLAEAFHEGVFSARVPLTQTDLRSLDGSPLTSGRGDVDVALPELLREPRPAPSAPH